MKYAELKKIYEKYEKEEKILCNNYNEKFQILMKEYDNFYEKYINEENMSDKERSLINEMSSKDLKEAWDNAGTKESNIRLFREYFFSYVDGCIAVRNEMMRTKKKTLIYSYLFNLSHLMELNIKLLKVEEIKGFEDITGMHNIAELYKNKKQEFIDLGLEENVYNELIYQINELKKYVTRDDIPMCFKYPLDKDFNNLIITQELMELSFEDVEKLVNNQMNTLLIMILNYMLICIQRYKEFIILFENGIDELKEVMIYIDNELEKRKKQE